MRNFKFLFIVLALAVIMGGSLPLYNILVFQPAIIDTLINATEQDAVRAARHIVNDFFPQHQTDSFRVTFTPDQHATLEQLRVNYELLKIKIFSPEGEVVFSSDKDEIGKINRNPYFLQRVAKGLTVNKLVSKEQQSLEGQMLARDLVETYVPVMENGQFIGAFEFYFDVTGKKTAIDGVAKSSTQFLLLMTIGFLTLFAIVGQRMKQAGLKQLLAEREVHQLAYSDTLTGLPNRTLFFDRLEQAIIRARREKVKVALLYLDLDRFKSVNDTLGHHMGDLLLKAVAERLENLVRKSDTVARLGGDEFVQLLNSVDQYHEAAIVAEKLLDTFKKPILLGEHELSVTPSIGIALFPDNGSDSQTLLDHADMAMYTAKERGRNGYAFFCEEINSRVVERHQLEKDLRAALSQEQFFLVYQPQHDLASETIVGAEALIRWQHPQRGLVPPDQFISMAEETGLIGPIGEWVLRTACRQNKNWQSQGYRPIRVAVNLSAYQFRQAELLDNIDAILKETGLDWKFLELELTESLVMENAEIAIKTLDRFRARGIHLTIDDFGTGYSSLSYLKNFPVDRLKIDRSFVGQLPDDAHSTAIVDAILAMTEALKLEVVAEGVEDQKQLDFLKTRNCALAQGYFLGRPVPADEFIHHLSPMPAAKIGKLGDAGVEIGTA